VQSVSRDSRDKPANKAAGHQLARRDLRLVIVWSRGRISPCLEILKYTAYIRQVGYSVSSSKRGDVELRIEERVFEDWVA
jgi:hypothetical protein